MTTLETSTPASSSDTSKSINRAITQRITAVLFANKSIHQTGLMAIYTVMPIIAARMTGSDISAGVPGTAVLLGRAAGAYPVGWVMDQIGRRIGLSAGFMAAIVGAATGALSVRQGEFWLLLAGAFFLGMSCSSLDQARYIAAEVHPAARRAKAIGIIVFSGTIGSLGGRLVMEMNAQLTDSTGITRFEGPWLLAIALMGLGLLLNQVCLRPDPMRLGQIISAIEARKQTGTIVNARRMTQIFRRPNVIMSVAIMALAQLSMTMVMVVTPLHMDYAGYGTLSISTALMLHTLGMFAFSALTAGLISRIGRTPVVILGVLLLLAAGLAGYSASSLLSIDVAVFLLGLGWNLCHIAGSAMLSDELVSQERGRAQGVSEVVVGLTAAAGSLASGVVYGGYGYPGANAAALASVALLAIVLASVRLDANPSSPVA